MCRAQGMGFSKDSGSLCTLVWKENCLKESNPV